MPAVCKRTCRRDAECTAGQWCMVIDPSHEPVGECGDPDRMLPVIRTVVEFNRRERGDDVDAGTAAP